MTINLSPSQSFCAELRRRRGRTSLPSSATKLWNSIPNLSHWWTAADRVVDLTGNRILTDLWPAARINAVPDEETHVSIPPQLNGRRILVMPGALNLGDPVRRWIGADAERLRELRPYVFEDTKPDRNLTLTLSGLGS